MMDTVTRLSDLTNRREQALAARACVATPSRAMSARATPHSVPRTLPAASRLARTMIF